MIPRLLRQHQLPQAPPPYRQSRTKRWLFRPMINPRLTSTLENTAATHPSLIPAPQPPETALISTRAAMAGIPLLNLKKYGKSLQMILFPHSFPPSTSADQALEVHPLAIGKDQEAATMQPSQQHYWQGQALAEVIETAGGGDRRRIWKGWVVRRHKTGEGRQCSKMRWGGGGR